MKKPTILKMPHLNLLTLFSNKTCIFFKTIFVAMLFEPTNKKRFLSNALAMVGILLFMTQGSYGQALKSFGKRYDETLKGDILVIGNNILNRDFGTNGNRANDPYNIQGSSSIYNENTNMKWINIDPDGGNNFNSSSAKLTMPAASQSCYKILYAALYWSGTYSIAADYGSASGADRSKINKVRFKVGTGSYVDLTGNVIYDYVGTSGGTGALSPSTAQSARNPYACMIDVTNYVVTGGETNYTVANIASSEGGNYTSAGHSAGWSLFVVYEDPKQPSKFITSFDGFARIKDGDPAFTFPINGFKTIPSGPVKAKIAFTALEGDNRDASDNMAIVGNTIAGSVAESVSTVTTNLKPRAPLTPNIFNSSINNLDVNFTDRVPNSLNTFGFDTGVVELKNGGGSNTTIKNGETGANITLSTGADWYYLFFTALAVEVIEPKIIVTKQVFDKNNQPASNTPVKLGDILTYELQFQNVGNDNAKNFTITDQLPVNTIFKYPADIEIPLQAGVTHSYNSATRTITFTIADNLVTKNGNLSVPIRFKVQVVPTCANLTEPCNNIIKNTAKSKYTGEINTNGGLGFVEDSFSSYSACDISVPESTNFLVGVDDCKARNAVLCGDPLTISASGGYASYSWSTSPTGVPVIGTAQTITVTQPGTYYVKNTATPPCVDLEEVITVQGYDAKFNPLIKYADNEDAVTGLIPVCPNDGSVLPKIFLCTEDDKVDIDLSDLGATNITWETTTCVADPNLSDLCANESTTCTWTQAGPPGATFVANTAGQYRVSMSFGGCFSRFYFNVYKNGLKPTVTKKDIICGNNGSITIGGISGTGYEYSLSENSGYTSNNTFSISTAGTYTVYIRQVGVATNPCPFKVEGISIYKTDFDPIAPFVTQPLCHDSKGSIKVYGTAYNGAQYTYELFKGGVSIEKVINSTASEYEFLNKDAGSYTYTVTTLDGCSYNGVAEIIAPAALTAVASITKPLTCSDGEITVTPNNGTAPFNYFINGSTTAQTDPKIVVTTAGTYSIRVVDGNGCEVTISQRIDANPKPVFTIAKTDVLCYGAKSGVITFNVTNANGYTLAYSIDNGLNYVANGNFSSLAPGTYKPIVKYTLSGVDCFETRPDITITEPAAALTASAGVSELAGCGLAGEGKVRITNPQGGVPPYEYNFNNPANASDWTTVNDAYKAPGTYTVYIRDANMCIFSASVTVDPEPAEPVIEATPQIDYNCDGTATSTVTVANPTSASYTFEYYLDNVKNTNVPSNVFVNVPSGSRSIKVEYKLNSVSTFSNLLFEDFGRGEDTKSPGIDSAYCWEKQDNVVDCNPSDWHPWLMNDGDYVVTKALHPDHFNDFNWFLPSDHTKVLNNTPTINDGRFLAVNIGSTIPVGAILYSKTINDIIPNQPINVSLYMLNLLKVTNDLPSPQLTVRLTKGGAVIATQVMPSIPRDEKWHSTTDLAGGTVFTLNPENNTSLEFEIISNSTVVNGNDLAIDDISVYQLPKTCISSKEIPINIDPGKAFTAQITGPKNVTCNDLTNGEFTITATNFDTTKGYEYSINNGANWSAALFTSPVTVSNLAGNLYKVIVRPVGSSVAACAKPFDVNISAPAAVTLSASVTKQPTCTTGATITAIGGGGTPTYQYELRQSNGTTVVTAFVNNGGVFTNVPAGSYTVFVRDANNCQIPVGVSVSVTAPPALTAALATTTDYCYTTANPARLDVEVTGGTGPFTYKLNSNAAISSAATTYSFTNVAPGTHTIVVTDSNNCTAPISSIVIAPQLGLTVSLLNDLTCSAAASIGNPVITGGNVAPYTYTVSQNGGTPVVVSAFPYSATAAGTYVFTVTDSQGCTANSNTITVTAKTTPTITTNKTDITCNNANNGTITVTAAGGFTSAYTYEIAGPVTISQTTNKFTGLSAGDYDVRVIDSKGCPSLPVRVTIVNPLVVTASIAATDIGCSPTGTVPAVVTITAAGGTGTLQYSFNGNPYATSNTFSTTTAGPVNVLVRDANNCQIGPLTISIAAPEQFTAINITDFGWDCRTSPAGGHVNIGATGVSAPKRYSIISGPAGYDPAENADGEFKALDPGAYVFQVRDTKTNCTLTRAYTVKGTPDIVAGGNVTTPILCFGNLGAIQFTVSGLNGHRYDYIVTNTAGTTVDSKNNQSAPTISLANLPASAYTIVVKDRTTDCTATYTINLTQPTAALAIVSATPTKVYCSKYTSQVTVVATGGTLSYTYAYLPAGSTATPTYAPGNVLNINTNNGADLSWDIYVRDANGCTTKIVTPVTIPIDATLTISATANQCTATSNSFTITATGTGFAPLTYSLNGGAFQTSNTFTNLAPGNYTVTVKDGNGCPATTAPLNIAPRLTLSAALDKDITCVLGDEPARITLTKVGGAGTFTYEFSTDNGVNWTTTTAIAPFTTTSPGSYIFRVTDSNGCAVATTVPVVVSVPVVVTATETHVDPTCNGFTDGSIRLTATAGVAPFTYAIALSPTTPSSFGSANVFGGLVAGSYNYIVRDAKGCEASGTVVLNNPPAIDVNIDRHPIQCNTNIPGSIDVNVTSGGTAPYVYRLYDNAFTEIATYTETSTAGTPVYSFTGLNFGDYYITVVDANGCEFKSSKIRIETPPFLNMTATIDSNNCATGVDVTVTTLGGTEPYEYSIFGGPVLASGQPNTYTYTGLLHGITYFLQVRDFFNCISIFELPPVASPSTINITGTTSTNATCNGFANGTLAFTVQNFDASVTSINYEVLNALTLLPLPTPINGTLTGAAGGPVTGNITTLPAGNYVLKVTEATGTLCSAAYTFQITQPAQPLTSVIASNVPATCNAGALVTLTTTGGTGPYEYAYAVAPTVPTGGHVAGNVITLDYNLGTSWIIQVRDANGCTVDVLVTIAKDPEPTIDPIAPVCFTGAPVTITVTGTSFGTPKYSINGGSYQASNVFTINAAGDYTFRIQDSNGCEIASPLYTIQPQLTLQANMTQDLTCPNPASITLVPAGGTTTYTLFEVDNGTGYAVITTNPFTTTIAGTYKFRVTDSQGCQAESQDVIVTPNTTPTAIPVTTDVSCIGATDGTITLTPSGGNVAYEYSLNGGAYQASNVFSGLGVNTYTILVRDAKLCVSAPITVSIGQPTPLTATAVVTPFGCDTANAPLDAIVTITPAGGTPGYSYSFDNGATYQASSSFSVNTAQTINYIVKDANGCEVTGTADVLPYTPPTDMDLSAIPIYCNTPGLAATVTVNSVTGGVGPFVFEIISPTATTPSAPSAAPFNFNNLAADTYVIKVTDANGCSTTKAFVVEEADKIAVTAQLINNVYCNGDSTGAIAFTVANYIAPANYTESLAPPLGTLTKVGDVFTYTALPAGNYTFTITDNTSGCVAQIIDFAVSQPLLALDFLPTATKINCNNDNATITVTATGGTLDYQYAVVPVGGTPAPTAYGLSNQLTVDTTTGANMVWDVYVMDANGCVTPKTVTIGLDLNPSNITVASFSECPDPINGTYTFTINTPTGVGPFTYSIGGGFQTSPTFVVNAPGSYDVTVKDANGCSTTVLALVVIRQPLILTPTVTTPVSCANNDGVISVSTTGGSNVIGNYQYKIDGGIYPMSTPFTGLAFGTHRVYVQDIATGCEVFVDIDLQQATPITGFALAKTEVTCNGGTDGTITATMDTPAPGVNDNPVYTYTLSGTTTRPAQASPLFTGLAAGTYTVVVTSERGCTDTETITIIEPGLITVPAPTVVQFGCTSGNTGNLATITVTGVIGGSGTYLNYEFIKVGTPTNTVVQFSNSNVYTEANLLGGSYIVNVYDDKGCIGTSTATITIAPYIQLDQVNVVVDQAITCTNLENITVTATTIGGSATNLQYTLVDVTYDDTTTPPTVNKGSAYPAVTNSTGIFTNLLVGNYEITVRNLDTNCEIIGVHYVNNPDTFDLTIDNVVDVTCFGGTNGSARVTLIDRVPTPIDNAGPFDYTVYDIANPLAPVVVVPTTNSPTFGPITLTGLGAGTYMITATLSNSPYCTVSKNFTITGPSEILAISETHTEITCVTGNNDGSISATATGGWPGGYEFQLLNGTTEVQAYGANATWTGLTAGNYTINVKDSKGCIATVGVSLVNPTPIAFTTTTINQALQCNGDTNASITVNLPVTGGQGSNYLYTLNTTSATPVISSGPQSGNVFNNLGAGTYTVTVTDGWGCGTTSAPIVINEPTEVVASLVLVTTQTCSTQSTITLSATGGTGTYQYSTTPNFATVAGSFASSITMSVPVGTYRFYVRDANGCISVVSNDITIDPLPALQVVLDVQNAKINCNGDTNGVIVATATGGLGNYVYTLLDGTGNPIVPAPTQLTPGNFTQLPAGTYQVRVDSQDCNVISTGVVTITEPLLPVTASPVVTPVTCNGAANGIITVTASGGTGVIKYAISPRLDQFFDTGVFDQLAPGTYQIIVQDENGCFILLSEEITEPQPIFVNTVAGSEVQELCAGDNNAAFDVNITGGVAPYSVALDDINGTYVTGTATQNVFNFAGLTGGDHTVYIKDANGCTAEWIVTLDESVNLDPKATVTYGCDNNSPSNTVTVTLDASITNPADVDYALDGSTVFQASNIFSNVAPGFHTITARHTNGCEKTTIQFEVLGFTPLALTLSDGGLNEIVATATGGAGNYQYSFDGGNTFSSNNKLIYYKSGDYTVIVRDANGCEATATRYFEFIDIEIPNVFTPNGDGNNDTWTPTNTINYKDLTINIFDRYGRKVATLREGQGWDGKYNSLELPSGDYWYVLKLRNVQDDREFVGHFTLMR